MPLLLLHFSRIPTTLTALSDLSTSFCASVPTPLIQSSRLVSPFSNSPSFVIRFTLDHPRFTLDHPRFTLVHSRCTLDSSSIHPRSILDSSSRHLESSSSHSRVTLESPSSHNTSLQTVSPRRRLYHLLSPQLLPRNCTIATLFTTQPHQRFFLP